MVVFLFLFMLFLRHTLVYSYAAALLLDNILANDSVASGWTVGDVVEKVKTKS